MKRHLIEQMGAQESAFWGDSDVIFTEYVNPPIPMRGYDWRAYRDGYEPGCPLGTGRTRDEAVADLLARENAGRRGRLALFVILTVAVGLIMVAALARWAR